MEVNSLDNQIHNPTWLFDYDLVMDDISAVVSGHDFPHSATIDFSWNSHAINSCSTVCSEVDYSFEDSVCRKESGSRKRLRPELSASGSKACREKLRRDRLNERFLELGSLLEAGKPSKVDKAAILTDAVRMVTQLRSETTKLKHSNEELQEKIKELKAEKNELRDEKQRLKADKEKLEQQLKALVTQPGFLPHPSALGSAFTAQKQTADGKLMPFITYPGVAMPMWQFMQPAVVDTSQDHVLHPPVA